MKRLPGWVARDLRPTEFERSTVLQPITETLLAHSIRYTEPDSLWVRSTTRLLQDLPEAKPWAARPHDAVHGGVAKVFPNAPVSDEADEQTPDIEPESPSNDDGDQELPASSEEPSEEPVEEPTLTDALPDLEGDAEPGTHSILQRSAAEVPTPEEPPGLEGGDLVDLSPEAQAILDAEAAALEEAAVPFQDSISESEDFDMDEALARLPPDPLNDQHVRRLRWARPPLSAYDEPVPTPRWLLLLLLLFLGLAGGKTPKGEHFLDQLTREERAWSLNGQIGRGQNLLLGPGIIVSGPAQVSRVSVGAKDTTIQLAEGQIDAKVAPEPGRMLIVQAGPAVISTSNGEVDVIRDGETIHIWAENGKLWVRTQSETHELAAGEHLMVEGGNSYGTSMPTSSDQGQTSTLLSPPPSMDSGSSSVRGGEGAPSNENRSKDRLGGKATSTGNLSSQEIGDQPSREPSPLSQRNVQNNSAPSQSDATPSTNAPVFAEPAGKPFDDVLKALDAVERMTCDDDELTEIDKEEVP